MKIFTPLERRQLIQDWRNSGQSRAAYSRSKNIHPNTLYSWVKKESKNLDPEPIPGFIEIPAPQPTSTSKFGIEIETKGIKIRLSTGIQEAQLKVILSLLGIGHDS